MALFSRFFARTTRKSTRADYQSSTRWRMNRVQLQLESLESRRMLTFAPAIDYSVGLDPQAVVAADFNNDGRLDLATTAGDAAGRVSVRLGDGQGGFGNANEFATGASPRALAAGDFNNDGNLDLATIGFLPAMNVLLGNGDGSFRMPIDTAIHGGALAVAAGDFNADGSSDLVYTLADGMNWDNAAVAVLLANGQGGFTHLNAIELNGNWSPVGLALGDLNGDGRLDVVTANDEAGTVSLLLGNGDGTLSYSAGVSDFTTGPSPRAVAIGDFTDDGIDDLAVAGDAIEILSGSGDGTFAAPIRYSVTDRIWTGVATGDFDGDDRLDLLASDSMTGTLSEMSGNGDGTLDSANSYAIGSSPASIATGDFNGDGRPDAVTANAEAGTVSVLLNNATWPVEESWLAIGNANVDEGNTGTRTMTFNVTRTGATNRISTVAFSTSSGTAIAGSDYQTANGTITFSAGDTFKNVSVVILGDRLTEPNETFVVHLSNATNAVLADGQGIGTIKDDEPRISITDVAKVEGKKGQKSLFTFTVTLSAAFDQAVTMSFKTVDATAKTGDGDYVGKTGTLTFAPGETAKTITIEVKGDSKRESDETFYLDLFGLSSNALFTKNRGTGKILNDD